MTNREYLQTLSNDEFAAVALAKASEIEYNYYNSDMDIIDIKETVEFDFSEWLAEPHKV